MRQQHWYQWPSSLSAQLSQPSTNASSARPDLRIADTAVLRERALAADRPDADTLSIALKQKAVPRTHAKDAPYLTGDSDLPFACDPRLLLHSDLLRPYSSTFSLLSQCNLHWALPRQRDSVEAALVRKPGVDLGLFDELVY